MLPFMFLGGSWRDLLTNVERLTLLAMEAKETKNYERALDYYRQAAEQGNGEAMKEMGDFYKLGKGVERNTKTAITWYEKAAELGSKLAMGSLGKIYDDVDNAEYDTSKAVEWYRQAADAGDSDAIFALVRMGKKNLPRKYVMRDRQRRWHW